MTQALLGSYVVQSELGDFDPSQHGKTIAYVSDFQFVPHQSEELLVKICELHRDHEHLTPAEADERFLENAKKLAMYGVDLHQAVVGFHAKNNIYYLLLSQCEWYE